jgi:hypothetical protein
MLNKLAFLSISFIDLLVALLIVVLILILIFEVSMIISAIKNKNITENTRTLWIVGMLLIHPFVAIAYY